MRPDPVQLLDRLAPPPEWSEPVDLDTDTVAAGILDRVLTDTGNVVSLDAARRRRRTVAAAITITAVVAGGAVAAVWNDRPEQAIEVACFSDAAAEPEVVVPIALDGRSDPAALCATAWSDGMFGGFAPAGELRVCVTRGGAAAVIPGGNDLCDALGLAEFEPLFPDDLTLAVSRASREISTILLANNRCVPPAEAEGEVQTVLDQYGLSGWTITIDGAFSAGEPCASVALDPELTTVFLRPVHRRD